ncbi:hypothetical protein NIES4073_20150 [Kalymmatonema gypsitolerans NIES-4073]|nr:hypothetical protein NIES4073_20150 [Scytonema sp. NIES-4073]
MNSLDEVTLNAFLAALMRQENSLQKVFEAYVENNTPSAWRIFWYYGPDQSFITVWAIAPHP